VAGDLPRDLKGPIAAMLDGVSRTALAARAARLSAAYRAGDTSVAAVADNLDVLAYVVTRMPATFAVAAAVLDRFRLAAPGFAPTSLLDVGAGPGTASGRFIDTAGTLAAASGHPALAGSRRILADATRFGRDLPDADLVVANYVLAEAKATDAFVAALWRASRGALVLVEPGTPAGFDRIRDARAVLVAAGATIAAPCPHAFPCPIAAPDWCHFSERLARSRDHRLAKAADLSFEDEKYSYVVAARPTVELAGYGARILAAPRISKSGLTLKLCRQDGTIAKRTVPRRDRAAHAALRRARWGDRIDQSGSQGPESDS
jgi:ribosomal protein RSM22 (predicted rRNA methylase)